MPTTPTMTAVVSDRYGPPEVLRVCQVPTPSPKPGEVRVRIIASAVTASDIFIRSAHVSARLQVPFRLMMGVTKPRHPILGFVFSGVIDQAGEQTSRFAPGDAVYGGTGFRLGAYAEYRCMIDTDSRTHGTLALKPTEPHPRAGDRRRLRRPTRTPIRRQGRNPAWPGRPHLRRIRHLRNAGHPVRQVTGSTRHRRLQHEQHRPRQIPRRRPSPGLHPRRHPAPGRDLRPRPGLRRRTEDIATQAGLQEGPGPRRQVHLHRRRQPGTELPTPGATHGPRRNRHPHPDRRGNLPNRPDRRRPPIRRSRSQARRSRGHDPATLTAQSRWRAAPMGSDAGDVRRGQSRPTARQRQVGGDAVARPGFERPAPGRGEPACAGSAAGRVPGVARRGCHCLGVPGGARCHDHAHQGPSGRSHRTVRCGRAPPVVVIRRACQLELPRAPQAR